MKSLPLGELHDIRHHSLTVALGKHHSTPLHDIPVGFWLCNPTPSFHVQEVHTGAVGWYESVWMTLGLIECNSGLKRANQKYVMPKFQYWERLSAKTVLIH